MNTQTLLRLLQGTRTARRDLAMARLQSATRALLAAQARVEQAAQQLGEVLGWRAAWIAGRTLDIDPDWFHARLAGLDALSSKRRHEHAQAVELQEQAALQRDRAQARRAECERGLMRGEELARLHGADLAAAAMRLEEQMDEDLAPALASVARARA